MVTILDGQGDFQRGNLPAVSRLLRAAIFLLPHTASLSSEAHTAARLDWTRWDPRAPAPPPLPSPTPAVLTGRRGRAARGEPQQRSGLGLGLQDRGLLRQTDLHESRPGAPGGDARASLQVPLDKARRRRRRRFPGLVPRGPRRPLGKLLEGRLKVSTQTRLSPCARWNGHTGVWLCLQRPPPRRGPHPSQAWRQPWGPLRLSTWTGVGLCCQRLVDRPTSILGIKLNLPCNNRRATGLLKN